MTATVGGGGGGWGGVSLPRRSEGDSRTETVSLDEAGGSRSVFLKWVILATLGFWDTSTDKNNGMQDSHTDPLLGFF